MNLEPILFIVAIVAVFYLLLIRPQQKRRKQQQQMQQSLRPGTEIVTTAGMYAKVVAVDPDDSLLLEVAPGVTCKYMKQAVMRVIPESQQNEQAAALDQEQDASSDEQERESAEVGAGADQGTTDSGDSTDGTQAKDAAGDGDAQSEPSTESGSEPGDTKSNERQSLSGSTLFGSRKTKSDRRKSS